MHSVLLRWSPDWVTSAADGLVSWSGDLYNHSLVFHFPSINWAFLSNSSGKMHVFDMPLIIYAFLWTLQSCILCFFTQLMYFLCLHHCNLLFATCFYYCLSLAPSCLYARGNLTIASATTWLHIFLQSRLGAPWLWGLPGSYLLAMLEVEYSLLFSLRVNQNKEKLCQIFGRFLKGWTRV